MLSFSTPTHIEAMNEMRIRMTSAEATNMWMDERRRAFNNLPDYK